MLQSRRGTERKLEREKAPLHNQRKLMATIFESMQRIQSFPTTRKALPCSTQCDPENFDDGIAVFSLRGRCYFVKIFHANQWMLYTDNSQSYTPHGCYISYFTYQFPTKNCLRVFNPILGNLKMIFFFPLPFGHYESKRGEKEFTTD